MIDRLQELKQSLVDKTSEERLAILRGIREDRKISKYAITVKAKREQDKGKSLKSKFAGLSPEEQKAFLETLKNED